MSPSAAGDDYYTRIITSTWARGHIDLPGSFTTVGVGLSTGHGHGT